MNSGTIAQQYINHLVDCASGGVFNRNDSSSCRVFCDELADIDDAGQGDKLCSVPETFLRHKMRICSNRSQICHFQTAHVNSFQFRTLHYAAEDFCITISVAAPEGNCKE